MALLLLCGSCSRGKFTVELKLPQQVNENFSILYYDEDPWDDYLEDKVLVVHQGECTLECPTQEPTLVYVFQGAIEPALMFYAERGDKIEITGDSSHPISWTVGGNKINRDMSLWRQQNRDILMARDISKVNAAVAMYVRQNPDNPAAKLILLQYYYRGYNYYGFDKLYNSMKGAAADPKWSLLMGHIDYLLGYSPVHPRAGAFTLTVPGGKDTLSFAESGGILYFSENSSNQRDIAIDELRDLARMRRDSAWFVVADISMEPDSAAWAYQMKRDSIMRGIVRGWMPVQFSDTAAIALGVNSLPMFVVIERGGRIVYTGPDHYMASMAAQKVGIGWEKPEMPPHKVR